MYQSLWYSVSLETLFVSILERKPCVGRIPRILAMLRPQPKRNT